MLPMSNLNRRAKWSREMTTSEYAENVVLEFMRKITDHVFLSIQGDERLMRDYQTQVDKDGLRAANTAIGSKVKELLDLGNGAVCSKPKSLLLKDFTCHKPKTE
jgi:hypothetical protein